MADYFYIDQDDQKQGPVSREQLQERATQGIITPHTRTETEDEKSPGFFDKPEFVVQVASLVVLCLILGTMWYVLWDVYSAMHNVQQDIPRPFR